MTYHLVITNAPEAYDYDYTMQFDREDVNYLRTKCRVVFVKADGLRNQLDRYLSGSYVAVEVDSIAPLDYRWEVRTVTGRDLFSIITLDLEGERTRTLCFACIVPATRGTLRVSASVVTVGVCDRCGISAESLAKHGIPRPAFRTV